MALMHEELPPGSRVVIVDSSAILKSCFEGYKENRTSTYKGRSLDVAGLYGYFYRTQKIYQDFEFEALVHIIDPPGGSYYRYNLFPEYKGNRKDDDPVLAAHKALLPSALAAFGERYIRMRGVESDDVIATLALQCVEAGHQVMIISPDKDLLQLVADGQISVARYIDNPNGFGKTYDIYETEVEVTKKLGIRPDQVADYLALVGDTADNIAGVYKAGPKTAAKWLAEHGDLATLLTNADSIPGKIGENLRAAAPMLPLYQKLTSVLKDVPGVGIPVCPTPDDETHAMFRELLLLKDTFPSRFQVGAVATYIPPARSTSAPAPAPAAPKVQDTLVAPAEDTLASPSASSSSSDVLGTLFGSDPVPSTTDVEDPFASLGAADASEAAPAAPAVRTGRPARLR